MLFKLSMSGLKSKLKDYIVLLVGLVMSISIFYMFQTLALNKAFIESNSVIQSIGFVFQAGSFFTRYYNVLLYFICELFLIISSSKRVWYVYDVRSKKA